MRHFLYKAKDAESHKEMGRKLQELPEGQYVIQVKKNRAIRSLSYNKYYHFVVNVIATHTGLSHDELHEALKYKFNRTTIFFPDGSSEQIGKTTSDLDVAEMAGYVNRVKQFALDNLGIIIPDLKDVDYMKWMEAENNYENSNRG